MSRLVRGVVGALLAVVLFAPGMAGAAKPTASEPKQKTVSLQSSKALLLTASDLKPGFMTYLEGRPTVRGKFRVDAVAVADAMNMRAEKPVMIFVLDRARAAANGCTLHADIMFTAMINTVPVDGKQDVVFGMPNGNGEGAMPLGAYHDMERRGCIAVQLRAPDDVQ
ncbi:MAG: hypothetical protein WBK91_08490 [Alphaproteobacteria bacterium]